MNLRALHVIDLDSVDQSVAWDILSIQERQRADAFHFDRDRRRRAASRAALRRVLAHYTNERPEEIAFASGPHGRPALAQPSSLDFNLSHSGGFALIGLTDTGRIGVDLEPFSRGLELEECASAFCTPSEMERISHLSSEKRAAEHIRLWCAKEAALKCHGTGLGLDPATLPVDWQPDGSTVVRLQDGALTVHLRATQSAPDFCCAIALSDSQPCPAISAFDLSRVL